MGFKRLFHMVTFAGLTCLNVMNFTGCTSNESNDGFETVDKKDAKQHNIEKFNNLRSHMKFALAFVENFSDSAYDAKDGKWTVGYGCTVLYNADGSHVPTQKSTTCSMAEADVYMGRYLTYEVLPDVSDYIHVPLDDAEMLATCLFRYCVGHNNFCKSEYLKALNNGLKGPELAKRLTGFRQQSGVLKRLYFPSALLCDKLSFHDLLNLRAEGCYNLYLTDVCKNTVKYKSDDKNCLCLTSDGYAIWDFNKLPNNLKKAGQTRRSVLGECKKTKDIVCDYILQDISSDECDANTYHYEVLYDSALNTFRKGNPEHALELYQDLSETSYNPALVQNDISVVQYSLGNYNKALRAGKRALKKSEDRLDSVASFYNMGMAHDKCGCYHQVSLNYLRRALNLAPNNETIKKAVAEVEPKAQAQAKKIQHCVYGCLIGLLVLGMGWMKFVGPDKTKIWLQQMKQHKSR